MDDPEAGARVWAEHAASQVAPDAGDVVVVAHSMGGLALPLVAGFLPESLPVRRLVALSALLPQPNMSFVEFTSTPDGADAMLLQSSPAEPGEETRGAGTTWETFRTFYVHDCAEADARWAWEQLRPRAVTAFFETATITAWPSIPTTSIVMTGDRIVNPDWSRRVARRIGAGVVELGGGHSPFLANPALLASALVDLAQGGQDSTHGGEDSPHG
jgi:pimeloyl-ACP methyl ester carboxylesterase